MRIGMFAADPLLGGRPGVQDVLDSFRWCDQAGLHSAWVPHVPWTLDAFVAATLGATVTERVEIGTAVVPLYARHPLGCTQESLSVSAVSNGRFTLGLGPSHAVVAEKWYGESYSNAVEHVRDYVRATLTFMAAHGPVSYSGTRYRSDTLLMVPDAQPPSIMLAALGPRMLRFAGEECAGTITWMGDVRTHAEHIVPRIVAAATGRPAPASSPACRSACATTSTPVGSGRRGCSALTPTFRRTARMLERGDASGPADVCLVGPESAIRAELRRYEDAGVTAAVRDGVRPGVGRRA